MEDVKKPENEIVDVLILGSGPAGLTAAIYAARADLKPLVLTGMELGGQASLTNTIENYPGFPDGVGGNQLGELLRSQAEKFGATVEFDLAAEVDLKVRPFRIQTDNKEIFARSLIIATGATPVHLGIEREKELTGKGVSYCATCDGWFFKDKTVSVIGGGDSALEEALFLTRFANIVNVIHRRDTFRASAILQNRVKDNSKIKLILDTVVTKINGTEKVESVSIKNLISNEEKNLETNGLFIFIGHSPNTGLFRGQIDMDELGYIKTDNLLGTNIEGVFVAGEAADPNFKQVVTSAGMGAAAAIQATRFLEGK